MISKTWEGTNEVCIGKHKKANLQNDKTFDGLSRRFLQNEINGKEVFLHEEGDECDGDVIAAIPPINMNRIVDKLPCAKRGGPNFIETVRVNNRTLKCPSGYMPCSIYTNPTDTICIPNDADKDAECPILDMFVVHE